MRSGVDWRGGGGGGRESKGSLEVTSSPVPAAGDS